MHVYSALLCIVVHSKYFTMGGRGLLGGHKGHWAGGGGGAGHQGYTPPLLTRSALGFITSTESQDLGLTSHLKEGTSV